MPKWTAGIVREWATGWRRRLGWCRNTAGPAAADRDRRRSERHYKSVFNNNSDIIFLLEVTGDGRFRYQEVNPAFEKILGLDRGLIVGKYAEELFPPDVALRMIDRYRRCVESGVTLEEDSEFESMSGFHAFHSTLIPEHDADGRIQRIVGISRDITQRKRIEAALRFIAQRAWTAGGEQFFPALVQFLGKTLEVDYAVVDKLADDLAVAETVAVYAKGELVPNLRYSLKGTPCENAVGLEICCYPQDLQALFPDDALLADLQVESYAGIRLWDSAGNAIGLIAVMDSKPLADMKSVLELLRLMATSASAEMEHERSRNILIAREREFRTVVENSPDFIIRYDRECRRTYVNPYYEKLTGMPAATYLGKTPLETSNLVAAAAYQDKLMEVMASGLRGEIELLFLSAAGNDVWGHAVCVPERGQDGEITGVLTIGRDITERKRQESQEKIRLQIFEQLAHGSDLEEILELVVEYVETIRPDFLCSILLVDAEGKRLLNGASLSLPPGYQAAMHGVEIGEGAGSCGTAAWRGERIIVDDISAHPYWDSLRRPAMQAGLGACWSEPVFDSADKVIGTFAIYLCRPARPTEADLQLIHQASNLAAIAIERKRSEEKLHYQASYDGLTGLPNRGLFGKRLREEISRAKRSRTQVALLFIDLDHFKEVNDTLGHDIGDQLLIEAAQRIRHCVRESDTVARLGGDEFVVVLPEAGVAADLMRVAQAIIDAVALPFRLGSHATYVSASIGIASYPQDADSTELLISYADQAMYAAKDIGRNGFSFFTRAMQDQVQQRLRLSNDLRGALANGQLQVHYQPIVDIASGEVVKAEALLRWQHPEQGWVPPDLFIPIAEETGTIHEIGAWVFREAAVMAMDWAWKRHAAGRTGVRGQISVNISPRQFAKGRFDEACIDYLQAMAIDPQYVVIEITEGLLLNDQFDVTDKLQRFHDAGIQVALDDFGTGYSAMAYLKKFNIDYLKIDRSFVRDLVNDPNDRAIAEAIVVMAHKLGLQTIAEGVETAEQRDLLAAVGCEYVQGYFYAKPMPAEAFLDYAVTADRGSRG